MPLPFRGSSVVVEDAVGAPADEEHEDAEPDDAGDAAETGPGEAQVALQDEGEEEDDDQAEEAARAEGAFELGGGPADDGDGVDEVGVGVGLGMGA